MKTPNVTWQGGWYWYQECDTEICESCSAEAIEGLNAQGECSSCERNVFAHNLRLMAAGVTRDKKTGRYASVGK